eukprot:3612922-Rhodomonas_salina.1
MPVCCAALSSRGAGQTEGKKEKKAKKEKKEDKKKKKEVGCPTSFHAPRGTHTLQSAVSRLLTPSPPTPSSLSVRPLALSPFSALPLPLFPSFPLCLPPYLPPSLTHSRTRCDGGGVELSPAQAPPNSRLVPPRAASCRLVPPRAASCRLVPPRAA